MFNKEYVLKQIKSNMDLDVFNLLKKHKAMLAGGAITSILTRQDINDFDIYFKNKDDMVGFLSEIIRANNNESDELDAYQLFFLYKTNKSITFRQKDVIYCNERNFIQVVSQSYYPTVYDIFKDFDFTINMIGFDFDTEDFYYHEEALMHIAQRLLVTNGGTKFPLMSVLRLNKYQDRGYYASKKEVFKLLLACSKLELNSYDDVCKHLGGMYAVQLDKLFDTSVEFSIDECINQLSIAEFDKSVQNHECYNYDNFLEFVDNLSGITDILDKMPFIKYVKKVGDNEYVSHYDSRFKYTYKGEIIPKITPTFGNYFSGGIYAAKVFSDLQYYGTLIVVKPIDSNEKESPFKKGVIFEKIIDDKIKSEYDYAKWLHQNGYLSFDEASTYLKYFSGQDLNEEVEP